MTPPDFSVLLLAWDEADPRVAVLGGAALPPTLPLVYRLAAEQPVVALYPHLPEAPETDTENRPATAASSRTKASAAEDTAADTEISALETAVEAGTPGIRRLDQPVLVARSAPFASLLIGLNELNEADAAQVEAALPAPNPAAQPASALARSQWPTGVNAPQGLSWQTPAAPYLGSSTVAGPPVVAPVPSPRPTPTVREAADLAQAARSWPTGFSPLATAAALAPTDGEAAPDAAEEDTSEAGPTLRPEAFDEPIEEMGPDEASDLSAPEDNLTPDKPAPSASVPELPAPPPPEAVLTARTPALDGLNFRMIEYARQAARLVRNHAEFGVIYAPNWPAWLAALEIRNSTGQPLVLYAASLATDFTSPAERGWLLEIERMALRRARLILVPDDGVGQRMRAQYGTSIGEILVVAAADEDAVQHALQGAATS
ncbi:MAG TPA: glycosyltransferase family 4 protein [Hymenobacter sp.]|jgi:hypothetical protein|uniref:glycosyltransferase family 4 protein n=1 Tax=Hymenobacter sp. TaxID=1898978 RepID=UPI002ED8BE99